MKVGEWYWVKLYGEWMPARKDDDGYWHTFRYDLPVDETFLVIGPKIEEPKETDE